MANTHLITAMMDGEKRHLTEEEYKRYKIQSEEAISESLRLGLPKDKVMERLELKIVKE